MLVRRNSLALLLLKRRKQVSETYRAESGPESNDPLLMIEYHGDELRVFHKHMNRILLTNDYLSEAEHFLLPEREWHNPLIAGFYEAAYPDNPPANDVLAYDIYTMHAMAVAARSAFVPDERALGTYNSQDARTLPLLVNGRGDTAEGYSLNNRVVNPHRVRSGMCFGMRRVTAVLTPLRVEHTFYEKNKPDILAGIQNLTGLSDDEIEHVDRLTAVLRSRP